MQKFAQKKRDIYKLGMARHGSDLSVAYPSHFFLFFPSAYFLVAFGPPPSTSYKNSPFCIPSENLSYQLLIIKFLIFFFGLPSTCLL
jgi:hypothetical protein